MGFYAFIRAFAHRVYSEVRIFDVAILNTALVKMDLEVNAGTGREQVLQGNYLSTMLLAISLLPELKKKSPARTPSRLSIIGSGNV